MVAGGQQAARRSPIMATKQISADLGRGQPARCPSSVIPTIIARRLVACDSRYCDGLADCLMLGYLGEQTIARDWRRPLPTEGANPVLVPQLAHFQV